MAHAVLLRAAHLAEGLPEGRIEEDGIVAEAVRASRLLRNPSLDALLGLEQDAAVPDRRHRRGESGAPSLRRQVLEAFEEHAVAIVVGRAFATEAARVEPGPAAEGVDRQPRIVGHREQPRLTRVVTRLEDRVLHERRSRLRGRAAQSHIAGRDDAIRHSGEQLAHLPKFPRVGAAEQERRLRHARSPHDLDGRARRREAGGPAVDSRTISCVANLGRGDASSRSSRSNAATAAAPISISGCRTAVRAGVVKADCGRSSKPTIDTSRGTRRPRTKTAITAPRFAVLTRASALTTRETVAAETPARRAMSRIVKDDLAGPDRARMVDPKSTDPAPGHQAEGSGQVLARPAPEG